MKKILLASLLFAAIFIAGAGRSTAQTTTNTTPTPVATTAGTGNTVQGFLVVCSDSVILNFSGTMFVGWDIFYQVFAGSAGSGTALTNVRQVSVAGNFAVSDRALYNSGQTVATGGTASAKVNVARESNPSTVDFSFVLTDTQDGCNNPQNPLVSTADTAPGNNITGGTTTTTNTASATTASSAPVSPGITTPILSPFGGALNPNLQPEPNVVVGPRLSDRFRSTTPGLIFSECDAFPLALPGILFDNDTITIFWSWFTKTQAEMTQELANAIYTVHLNTAPLPMTQLSAPKVISGNVWVFYTATVGNLRPGHYEVGFLHTWANPVNDGYNDYGPGTARTRDGGTCNFDVTPNGDNQSVAYTGMYFPSLFPTHDIHPEDQ